ncbi:MAG: hypothetical protein EBV83_03980 [Verrucomicrobia bacterium]|nr:hypothetical protein [Verrucomicrobiota bacterium]
MFRHSFLLFGILSFVSFSWGDTVQVNTTSDGYLYLGAPATVNSTGYYLDVGLYGTPGNHYSIAYAKFNTDLSSLSGAQSIYLAINLRNFVAPVFGNGPAAQPTSLDYPTSGGNFTLKVVPLASSFTGTGVDAAWVTTNLIGPSAAGTIILQNGGYNYVDITSTVKSWIANSSSVKELGFVGVASTPNTWSLNLGTLENQSDLDNNIISAATPMYLTTIPEPSIAGLATVGWSLMALSLRRRAKS